MVVRGRGRFRHINGRADNSSSGRRVRARLALGYSLSVALEHVVVETLAAEVGVGFNIAAALLRQRELAASQSFGIDIAAELTITEQLSAALSTGFDM